MSKGTYTCTYCRHDHVAGCANIVCPIGFHNVKSLHPDEIESDGSDPLETALSKNFEIGRVGALEDIPKRLARLAGEAFAAGKDERAHFLRDLAKDFDKEAKQARTEWAKKYGREGT